MKWKRAEFKACGGRYSQPDYSTGEPENASFVWRGRHYTLCAHPVRGAVSDYWGIYNCGEGKRPFCLVHLGSGCAAGYFPRQKDAMAMAEKIDAAFPEYRKSYTWGGLGMKALGRRSSKKIKEWHAALGGGSYHG